MANLVLKLTGDDSHRIRGMLSPDGMQVFSVYDFITVACAKTDKGVYARKCFGRLTTDGSEHQNEIVSLCHNLHFPGQRGAQTPAMTIRGLQRLLMILGGKVAAEFRALVEGVFTRVMAGDQSLIEVINANAASNAPINQVYREALAQEPVVAVDELSLTRKRRIEELEIVMLEAEVEAKIAEVEAKRADIDAKKLANAAMASDNLAKITDRYHELCQDTVIDERARLMLKDGFLNMALAAQQGLPGQGLIENGPRVSPNKPVSLSSVATELGFKIPDSEFIVIGKRVATRYFELHGKKPTKHDQLIKGKVTLVNSYTESDRPLVEEVLREYMAGNV